MVTATDPVSAGALYVTEQVPDARVQSVGEKDPPAESTKLIDPVGVTVGDGPVSCTVTVQSVCPVGATSPGTQFRLTDTGLGVTLRSAVPAPALCSGSPE